MLPFIQCHQTRGRAPLGGFSKPLLSGSGDACPHAPPVAKANKVNQIVISRLHAQNICFLQKLVVVLIAFRERNWGARNLG
jgi:hypothetical protein